MATQKLYAGVKLRALRQGHKLTQKQFAEKIGVSLPYLNQMENNNRPVSTAVLLALATEFGLDVTELQSGDAARLVGDMREALADPLFADAPPPLADLRLMASNAPALSHAFLNLHSAYRRTQERLAALDETLGREEARLAPSPWEEVRDFFHYCDNYIDAVDRSAEGLARDSDPVARALADLEKQGISLHFRQGPLRQYDPETRVLQISGDAPHSTQNFQILLQHALLQRRDLLEATLDLTRFHTPVARDIARIGLANYYAGAALMPYGAFARAARDTRHDLERLATRFGASLEQVAHRLSTLQRPGAKGVPFFFVRVDPAGTITKRHSATSLQFARYGGACPLWNVHRAFETPGQWLRQLAETPDGIRYFCLARDVSKPSGGFDVPVRRYAIGLGCELRHLDALVYGDTLQTEHYEPIGISCRICERPDCPQRALPPLERRLEVDPNARHALPYRVS